jgi:hypothetical protein
LSGIQLVDRNSSIGANNLSATQLLGRIFSRKNLKQQLKSTPEEDTSCQEHSCFMPKGGQNISGKQ